MKILLIENCEWKLDVPIILVHTKFFFLALISDKNLSLNF